MWLSVLPQILLAAVLLLAPGLIISAALRFRSFDALSVAPAVSIGVLVVTSTAAPFLGLEFGLASVAAVTIVLSAAGYWLRRKQPGTVGSARVRSPLRERVAPWAAITVATAIIAWRTTQVIGTPESISQTYDAVFHLNSVRYALDTGQASSLTIGGMTGGGFYPAGWNATATFVAAVTGTDVPVAVNITTIVLASIFWPLSCLLMTAWIVGRKPAALLAGGIACASLGAFPLLMMDFGVLYPNLLAVSILPANIAIAARLLGVARSQRFHGVPASLLLLLCLTGLAVSHPTTLMAWLVWTLPMVGCAASKRAAPMWKNRAANRKRFYFYAAGLAAYTFLFLVLWVFLRPPEEASFWGPYSTVPQALGEAIFVSPLGLAPSWLVAPLAILGLWTCFRRAPGLAWAGIAFLAFSIVYVVVSGFPISPLRNFVAGVWYNDSYRVAALLPTGAVLLAALGADWLHSEFNRGHFRLPVLQRNAGFTKAASLRELRVTRFAAAVILCLGAIALGQQGGVQHEVAQASTRYSLTDESPLVSKDEFALIQRLERNVPAGSTLLGNPYTGAALSYALGDRKAAQLHILSYVSPELQEIYSNLGRVSTDPDVCEAVRDEGAFYVLDFGAKEVHGGNHTPPGLKNLTRNPGVRLVDSQGEARLYRITACGA